MTRKMIPGIVNGMNNQKFTTASISHPYTENFEPITQKERPNLFTIDFLLVQLQIGLHLLKGDKSTMFSTSFT